MNSPLVTVNIPSVIFISEGAISNGVFDRSKGAKNGINAIRKTKYLCKYVI